jgi:iron complex outermembrane receptor protein
MLLIGTTIAAPPSEARNVKYNFDIPSQSLNDALQAFALASHHKLLYSSELVDGKISTALKGEFTIEGAVQALLSGTHLRYEVTSDGLVLIRAAPPPSGAATLTIADESRLNSLAQTTPAQNSSPVTPITQGETISEGLEEVIVTGTRETGVRAADSAAPIQVIRAETLKAAGAPDLMSALAQVIPSLEMVAYGGDMSGQTLQARLRGLSPNDVLILINGKRRHTTANLSVDPGSPFQGGAGVDLNFIPLDAIDHIEVLTDGAAAQYGTDAIAGVINIILKKNSSGGNLSGTFGQYGNNGGGRTEDVSGNVGLAPTGGFFSITGDFRNHGYSNDAGEDPRFFPANISGYPDTNLPNVPGYPRVGQFGDGAYQQKLLAVNSGFDFDDDTELYFVGTYGHKNAASYQFYRLPSKVQYTNPSGVTTYPLPYGFNPQEASDEDDYQMNLGVKGTIASWDWDFTTGYGVDHLAVSTIDSYNAGTYAINGIPTPTNFNDGYLQSTQWTSTADFRRDFNVGFASPLNVAFGSEYRRDTYSIGAGVPLSYEDGGAQSFPGFTPADASSHSRTNYAGYLDLAGKPIDLLQIDAAVRFEHYSDFGDATVGKLTGRYDFSPQFAIRGTVSNGFRAPTLAEEYYSSTNVNPASAFIQLPPNSPAAAVLGLGNGLRPEKSVNFSGGFVWRPIPRMSATLDLYQITITNRVVGTGNIAGQVNGQPTSSSAAVNAAIAAYSHGTDVIDPDVLANGSTGITIFANGIDTRTDGADLVFAFPVDYSFGRVEWSVGATSSHTSITNPGKTPAQLAGNVLYNPGAYSQITTASPRYVINLGALLTMNRLTVNLVEKIYGQSSDWETDDGDNPTSNFEFFKDTINTTFLTNLDVGYQFTDHLNLSAGAVNLFNRFPNKLNGTILAHENAYTDVVATETTPTFSPFGINGGFYYVKAAYKF